MSHYTYIMLLLEAAFFLGISSQSEDRPQITSIEQNKANELEVFIQYLFASRHFEDCIECIQSYHL